MANQIKGKLEDRSSDFKITIMQNINNFSSKIEEKKNEIKFLGQSNFPELH
jgi:hypothetical protein